MIAWIIILTVANFIFCVCLNEYISAYRKTQQQLIMKQNVPMIISQPANIIQPVKINDGQQYNYDFEDYYVHPRW